MYFLFATSAFLISATLPVFEAFFMRPGEEEVTAVGVAPRQR
jgi:hypothetical protein